APAADDVSLAADDLPAEHRSHACAQLHHLTHELVADHQRRLDCVLRPLVPALDVEVRAADPGAENAKQHLARPGLRLGDVLQPQAWFPLRLDQGLHLGRHFTDTFEVKKLGRRRIEFRLRLRLGPLISWCAGKAGRREFDHAIEHRAELSLLPHPSRWTPYDYASAVRQ